jgi:hypothetical protein
MPSDLNVDIFDHRAVIELDSDRVPFVEVARVYAAGCVAVKYFRYRPRPYCDDRRPNSASAQGHDMLHVLSSGIIVPTCRHNVHIREIDGMISPGEVVCKCPIEALRAKKLVADQWERVGVLFVCR